jgi:hypothetical protein
MHCQLVLLKLKPFQHIKSISSQDSVASNGLMRSERMVRCHSVITLTPNLLMETAKEVIHVT